MMVVVTIVELTQIVAVSLITPERVVIEMTDALL